MSDEQNSLTVIIFDDFYSIHIFVFLLCNVSTLSTDSVTHPLPEISVACGQWHFGNTCLSGDVLRRSAA